MEWEKMRLDREEWGDMEGTSAAASAQKKREDKGRYGVNREEWG